MPVAQFSILDVIVVLIYVMLMLGVGLWAASGQTSQRDYFLGGRSLSWWVVGLSILATETSALTFIGIPAAVLGGLSYSESGEIVMGGGNLFFILLIIGYVIGRSLIALYIVPLYFHGDVYTPYQLLNRAFGPSARYTAGFLSYIGIALGAGVRVYVTAIPVMIVMQTYVDWWSINFSILFIMVAALIYTAIGGIKAVVWTDMIQFFIFIIGGGFALIYIPTLLNGDLAASSGATGWGAVNEVAGGSGVLDWWNSGFLATSQVAENLGVADSEVSTWQFIVANLKNIFAGPYNIIMGLIPTTVGILFAFGFDQLNVQRILGCKDVHDGRKAMMLSAILILPQFLLFLMIGAVLYAYYQLNGMEFGNLPPSDPTKVDPETGREALNASFVFPIFIITHIPVVMKGLLVAAILAAAMSSVSSAISAMSSISIMDFYRPIAGESTDEEQELRISRYGSIFAGVALALVAYICNGEEQLIDLAFTMAGLTAGPILGAFLWGMWKKGGHSFPVVAGMLTSFLFMVAVNVLWAFDIIWQVTWPWHTMMGVVVSILVAMGCNLLVDPSIRGDITRIEEDG